MFSSAKSGVDLSLSALCKRLKMSYPHDQRRLLKHARRVFTLSAVEEESLRRFFGSTAATSRACRMEWSLPVSVTPRRSAIACGIRAPFVLQVASFYRNKRQKALIDIANRTNRHVVFIGGGFDSAYMAACQRVAGPTVHILGEIPYGSPLIAGAYAAAKVFCLPSKREVMSLAAMEAAKAGLPMILGDRWGAGEYFGDDARYVSPYDFPEWRPRSSSCGAKRKSAGNSAGRNTNTSSAGRSGQEAAGGIRRHQAEKRRAEPSLIQSPLRATTATINW